MAHTITCAWILGTGKACGGIVPDGQPYCRVHNPMASIFRYEQEARAQELSVSNELPLETAFDIEAERKELQQAIKRFKRDGKTLKVKRSDFPCIIDGIPYADIQEFWELNQPQHSHELEMPGSDQQLLDFGRRQKYLPDPQWKPTKQKKAKPLPPLPPIYLEPNTFRRLEHIKHMHYVVARRDDHYFALWVSVSEPDTLDEVLKAAKAFDWPLPYPVEALSSRIYTSGAKDTFRAAEDVFWKGSETFSKIKERIKKAEDPNYIPPNLRGLAVEATYHAEVWNIIPQNEHGRLCTWLQMGCRGWWGKNPNPIYYKKQGWKYTPVRHYSSDGYQAH